MRRHIAISFICISASALAQPVAHPADSIGHTLGEVVVSENVAPKSATSASPVFTADRSAMIRAGVVDVSDAVHRMPGITLRDYGGAGGLKTVSVRGFGAGHTGVVYDGVALSDVQSGQIDLSRYSIDNVGSISMTVGDNDDIFIPARQAASAATVAISSLPVTQRRECELKMRLGSFGYYNPFVKAGMPLGRGASVNFVGEFIHADNDYPFVIHNGAATTEERRNNSRMNSGHGEVNLLWLTEGNNTLSAKIYGYSNSRRLPGPVVYYNNDCNESLREQNVMAQAQWRGRISSRLSLNGILKYNFASSNYHDVDGKYPGGELIQDYHQREYYASAGVLYSASDPVTLGYSADYFFNNLTSNLPTDRKPYRNSILQTVTARYRSGRITLMGRLLGSLYYNGARKGTAADDAAKLSPSICVSVRPIASQQLFFRASYKNIFRMPTFNEAYFDHYGSEDILPESTDQINVGTTYSAKSGGWVGEATFTLDGYINNIHDMIVAVPYNMFIWRMVNLGKVRTYGIDATANVTVVPSKGHGLTFMGSYSYQRAMPRTSRGSSEWNKQVAYIPIHSGSASLAYENPWVNLSVSATGVSHRFTTNNNLPATRIAGYVELGVSAWRRLPVRSHLIDLRVDVQNLLNRQYYVVARYPMPGRQYKITVGFTF